MLSTFQSSNYVKSFQIKFRANTCLSTARKNMYSGGITLSALRHNSLLTSNKSPTRCNNFPIYYPDIYLQLKMFRALSLPSSEAQ